MQQGNTIFDLKGEARRLRTALAEMQFSVTHSAALNLVARAKGARNWETLEAEMTQAQAAPVKSNDQWLNTLEAALRLCDISEEDLDDLVHGTHAPEVASSINNQGLLDQLTALLSYFSDSSNPREALVNLLESNIARLRVPIFESNAGEMPLHGIPVNVSVCLGSPMHRVLTFDALEWFANHSEEEITRLIEDGLSNSESSDQVVLWLEEHSEDGCIRENLPELLTWMRTVLEDDKAPVSGVVGITASIDPRYVRKFLKMRMAQGYDFEASQMSDLF